MFHENNKLGFYLASREFEDWELKILMDAIAGARFLDSKNTKLILNKLYNLSSKEGSKILKMVSPIFNSNKSRVTLIKIYIDKILSAIKNEKQVSFKYIYYNVDLKLEYKHCNYVVNPYSLIWRNESYYLIGNTEPYTNLSFYRLDCIRNLEITDKTLKSFRKTFRNSVNFEISEYIKKTIFNYGGNQIFLVLKVEEFILIHIMDYFGMDIDIIAKNSKNCKVRIKTSESEGLYYWLLQYSDNVEVIEPIFVREKFIKKLKNIILKYK